MKHKVLLTTRLTALLFLAVVPAFNAVFAQCGSASQFKPIISSTAVCSSDPVTMTAFGLPISNWIYRDNGGAWQNTFSGAQSTYTHGSTFVSANATREYRAVVTATGCPSDTTLAVSVNISALSYGNNNALVPTASLASVCSGSTVSFSVRPDLQVSGWVFRDNATGSWNFVSGGTSYFMGMSVSATTVREMRALVRQPGTCTVDTSAAAAVTIVVNAPSVNFNVQPTASIPVICSRGSVTLSMPSGLSFNNWIYRNNGGAWQFFSSSTSPTDNNTNVATTTVRDYRILLRNTQNCSVDSSAMVSVTINAAGKGNMNSIKPAPTNPAVCSGSSASVSISSIYSGLVVSWLARDNGTGNWNVVSTSSSSSYSDFSTTVTNVTSRAYRAIVRNAQSCSEDTTAEAVVTIKPFTYGNTDKVVPLSTHMAMCSGVNAILSVPSNISVQNWLYKNGSGNWQYFTTGNTVTDFNTTTTTQLQRTYMVLVRDNNACTIDSSATRSITFKPTTYGNTPLNIYPTVSNATVCSGNTATIAVSVSTTNYQVLKWMYSNNGGTWTDNTSTSTTLFDFNTTVTSATSRVYKAMLRNNETCVADSSQPAGLQITPQQGGNLFSVVPAATVSSVCSGTSLQVTATIPSGYSIYSWQRRDGTTGNWTNMGSGTTVTDFNTTVTSSTTRNYRVVMQNASQCRYDTSASTSVQINARATGNNNSIAPQSTTVTTFCSGKTASMFINLPSGVSVVRWLYRDNNTGAWQTISTTSTSYSTALTALVNMTRSYRVLTNDNNTCSTDTSAALALSIQPYSGGQLSSVTPTSGSSSICSGNSVTINQSVVAFADVQRWIFRDNGGVWLDAGSASTGFTDNKTNVAANAVREYRLIYNRTNSCIADTTSSVTVNISSRKNGLKTVAPSMGSATYCSGSSVAASVALGTGESVVKWIYKDNTGPWMEYATTSSSISDPNTNVTSATSRIYRALLYNSLTCSYDTTLGSTVTINPVSSQNNASLTPTSTVTGICSGSSVSINISTTSSVRSWIYRDNGTGPWLTGQVSTSTSFTQTVNNISSNTTRAYKVIVFRGSTCNIDTSSALTIAISPLANGSVSTQPTPGSTSICSTSGSLSSSISLPANYTSVIRWQARDNSGAWYELPYNTASTSFTDYNLNVGSTISRSYRAILSSTTLCRVDTSAAATVSISPVSGGILNTVTPTSTTPAVCFGRAVQMSVSVPTQYSVSKWFYKDNNGVSKDFNFSTNSSSLTDNNTQTPVSFTRTYYVVFQSTALCKFDTSLGYAVTINPVNPVYGNSTTAATITATGICTGGTVALNISPGSGNTISKWIYRDNSTTPWTDVLNSASASLSHTNTLVNTTTTRIYRAIILSGTGCTADTSVGDTVLISIQSYGTDTNLVISSVDTICASQTLTLTHSSSGQVVKWIYRDNTGAYQDVPASAGLFTLNQSVGSISTAVSRTYNVLIFRSSLCRTDTSKSRMVYLSPRSKGNSTTKVGISTDTICVGSTSVSVNTPTGNVLAWMYRDNFSGPWNIIPFATGNNITQNISGITTNTTREFRSIVLGSNCSEDTTVSDTVVIKTISNGNATGVAPTSGNNVSCNGTSASISINPGSGNSVVKWIYRNNNTGPWLDFAVTTSTSITDYNTYSATPQTRVYRAILRRNCSNDTSDLYTLSLLPKGVGNDTSVTPTVNNSTICTGSSVIASVSLGSGKSVVRWIYKTGTGAWTVLSNTSSTSVADNYTITGTTITRQYAAIVYNSTKCSEDTTKTVSVTINPVTVGTSTINPTATSSSVCIGSSIAVSVNPGSGTVVKWVYNVNGGAWTDFGWSPSSSINDYNTNYSTTTVKMYRALIYTTSPCRIDTTNAVTVTINPRTYGNDNSFTFTAPSSSCSDAAINVSISSIGSSSIQKWLYRDNNTGNWNSIYSGATAITDANTTVTGVTTRTYRVLIIKSTGCTIDTSNAVNVVINPVNYGNDVSIKPTGTGSYCTGTSVSISVTPGSGNSVNSWVYRLNNTGPWLVYYNGNLTSFTDYNTYTSATLVKNYRALIYKSATCKIDTSAADTITINPRSYGNSTATPTASGSTVCAGTNINVNITLSGGNTIYKWMTRDGSGAWQDYSSTSTAITDYNTNVAVTTVRQYRALLQSAACSYDTSNAVTVTINPRSYGNSTATPTPSSSSICSGTYLGGTISLPGGSTVQKWLYRDNNTGAWFDLPYSTGSTSFTEYNTTVSATTTRSYRALIVSGTVCTIDTSNAAGVTLNPIGRGNSSLTPSAQSTNVCAGNAAFISVPTGNQVIQWLYRDNSSSAWSPMGASGINLSDVNTNVGSTTTRSYRAIVYTTGSCSYDTTNAVTVTINLLVNGNTATTPQVANATICAGLGVSLSVFPSGGDYAQSWIYRDGASGTWNVLTSSPGNYVADYNTNVTGNTTREYRAIIRNTSACSLDSTASVTVTLKPYTRGTDLTQKPNASASVICAGTGITLSLPVGSIQSWMYRDSVTDNWSLLSGGNYYTHYGTFVTVVKNRNYQALYVNSNNCSVDTTASVVVTINPNSTGNLSIKPVATSNAVCSGNGFNVNVSGYIGNITHWIYRDNSGPWNVVSTSTPSLTVTATTVTAFTTREFRAIIYSGCNTDSTLVETVTIDLLPQLPTITRSGDTLICSVTGATSYKWIRNGVDISGATAQKYVVTQNGSYVVEITNSSNCKNASVPYNFLNIGVTPLQSEHLMVRVYPNPSHDGRFKLDVNAGEISYQVVNTLGQVIAEGNKVRVNNGTVDIDVHEHATGLFFIVIQTESASLTKQLLFR